MSNMPHMEIGRVGPDCYITTVSSALKENRAPLSITPETIQKAKAIIGRDPVRAAGYRLKILLLEAEHGLDAGQKEAFPTLAAKGLVAKSEHQKSREDKGSDMAVIVDIGDAAWCNKTQLGERPWAKVGHVIRIMRYAGHSYEEPPGSGNRYAIINDEDVLGYYEEVIE